ncbi:MAG: phosphoribosyltransferase family protein [Campylobacterota bacterium]|nr:phosphoribosyltransferase family protein [Campylobacterota bacterium]
MKNNILFFNRDEAVEALVGSMPLEKMKLENWIVLATSANGVPIAVQIANQLNSSFDFLFSEKIYAPLNNECEVAIVTENKEVVIHEEVVKAFDIDLDFIYAKAETLYQDTILGYIKQYRDGKNIQNLTHKNVLLIDEGLNTGLTMMACIKTAITLDAKSVCVAVPIIPTATVGDIESIADDLYCPHILDHFISIDSYYDQLNEINFDEVKKILQKD